MPRKDIECSHLPWAREVDSSPEGGSFEVPDPQGEWHSEDTNRRLMNANLARIFLLGLYLALPWQGQAIGKSGVALGFLCHRLVFGWFEAVWRGRCCSSSLVPFVSSFTRQTSGSEDINSCLQWL